MNRDQQFEIALDEFNFHNVLDVMEFLDWKWESHIPTITEMKNMVRSLYNTIKHKDIVSCSSGGFCVSIDTEIRIDFIVESSIVPL